ncbi:MAG: DUF444 family protein [Candidatus Aminicenantes bacterium]|nr:DUF444 family protein [Candidatus Aminicenantes bacterium]
MNAEALKLYEELKKKGLDPQKEQRILAELKEAKPHGIAPPPGIRHIYEYNDLQQLQDTGGIDSPYTAHLRSMDDLLERDKKREKDGFPRKIKVGKLVRPSKNGKDKLVVVPTTVEEKFIHHSIPEDEEETGEGRAAGGSGAGEEGEVIGEQPIQQPGGAGAGGAGQGEEGSHEIESNAYDLGKILTEQFELPNLKDKGKKRFFRRYTYDLTDKHRGFGQVLDKKATLKKIVETNISLGRLPDIGNIDTTKFLVSPADKIYRILSKERDYESQAIVFFVRDYSGSMSGKPTELVAAQHVMIYSWLLYQYDRQVQSRFILHDTGAKEVPDFYTYYNSRVAGGTKVAAAFRLANEIVEKESLARDYNIYVFYGTDGDDWDTDGRESLPAIEQMLTYVSRLGITVARHSYSTGSLTDLEKYLNKSGLPEKQDTELRLDTIKEDADEARLIDGIKKLISE